MILENQKIETPRIAEDVIDLVGSNCGKIDCLDSLVIDEDTFAPMSTIPDSSDLDELIFKGMTTTKMNRPKQLFELSVSRDIL